MCANVLNYLYHMLCSRSLGVVEYGILATLVAAYSIVGALVNVLNLTTAKFAAEFHALDDYPRVRLLANIMMRVAVLAGAIVLMLTLVGMPIIGGYLKIDAVTTCLAGIAIAASLVLPAWRGVLQGMQAYLAFSISLTLESLARLGGGVGLALAGFRAGGAVSGFTLGSFVSLLYTGYILRKRIGHERPQGELKIDVRRLAKTSGWVALSTLALTVIGFVDVVLVRHFLSPHDAGLYGVLSLTGKVIIFSVSFLPTVLLPKAVERTAKGESARPILLQAIGATAVLSLAVLAIYWSVPDLVVRVMAGSAFENVAPQVGRYGVATALLAATTLTATYKIGIHRFGFVPRLCAVAVSETIAISFFHGSIAQVVSLVLGANVLALLMTLI
jgi:O-antigen/teichoic acid export membrane protein